MKKSNGDQENLLILGDLIVSVMYRIALSQCQYLVNQIFVNLLFPNHYVKVYNSFSSQITAIAYNTDYALIPLNAQGVILINLNYLYKKSFDMDEIFFILAHESMHIFLNHSLNRKLWNQILENLRESENDPIRYAIADGLRVISSIFSEKKFR